jgi:hypothetical protein
MALLAAALWLAHRAAGRRTIDRRFLGLALPLVYVLTVLLSLSVGSLPDGALSRDGRSSSLLSAWHAHSTMLYAVPLVRSSRDYLRRFVDIQPRLRTTIHGLSHPPVASLSMYWIGCAAGVKGMDIRREDVRLRYAIGLTLFSSLGVLAVYLAAAAVGGSRRTGLVASLLWLVSPAALAYLNFSQDGLYAVFFNLALFLVWKTVTAEGRRPWWALALGVDFFCLTVLNYSWCIVTTIFAVFAVWTGASERWRAREYARRVGLPLAVMAVLLGAFLVHYRLDYLRMYAYASRYVAEWYVFRNAYQWTMALIGGQLDLVLMMGSMTASAFLSTAPSLLRRAARDRGAMFLASILGVYAVPLLLGPPCLKMETSRCWNWVATVPLALGARTLLAARYPRTAVTAAVAVSALTYTAMRLFMDFGP